MNYTSVKQRFRVEGNRIVRVSSENNKDWTKIYSKKAKKEMIEQPYEIVAPEDNMGLSSCLIIVVPK